MNDAVDPRILIETCTETANGVLTEWRIDTIICSQMIEANIIQATRDGYRMHELISNTDSRFITGFANLFVDAVTTSVDGTILSSHDSFHGTFVFDITSKSWHFRNNHNNL